MANSYLHGMAAMQTTTTDTSYAGGGAWGQQGTASWTTNAGNFVGSPTYQWHTQQSYDSMRMQTQLRVSVPAQRIYMSEGVWSSWTDSSYTTQTETVSTLYFQQRVWGQWVEHEYDQGQQARYMLNEQGLEEVRRENARRQAEYERARARQQANAEEHARLAAEETERKDAAEDVAQVLLGEIIGEEQLAVYKETGRLLVRGSKHDYLVWKTGKVQRVEKNKIVDLCVYTKERIIMPATDNVIGLAMHIKADEKEFNKIANASRPVAKPKELALAANY